MTSKEANEIRPITLNDAERGKKYTLDFDAESVTFAQQRGFNINEWDVKPMVVFPQLFMYSFRKNHQNVSANVIQSLWDELKEGGLPKGMMERLMLLYNKPIECMLVGDDENETKNSNVTVEL